MINYYASPVGFLKLECASDALTGISFGESGLELLPELHRHPILEQAATWLDAYFAGQNPPIADLPIALNGTPYQMAVWQHLLDVPYGKTLTYGQIAEKAAGMTGKEPCSHAAGGALNRNPLAIVVPCHRIVGSNGDLVGYAGGLARKAWLLEHEKKGK